MQSADLVSGLIPQAPMHTASLVVLGDEDSSSTSSDTAVSTPIHPRAIPDGDDHAIHLSDMKDGKASAMKSRSGRRMGIKRQRSRVDANAGKPEVPIAVVEQRVSNLAQGCLCEHNDRDCLKRQTDAVKVSFL